MIVAGIGYQSNATPDDLRAVLTLIGIEPDALTSIKTKAQGPLADLARGLDLPLIAVPEDQIAGIPTPTCSPRIKSRFATGSVAEATALVAAGPGAHLIKTRLTIPNGKATIAVAKGTST